MKKSLVLLFFVISAGCSTFRYTEDQKKIVSSFDKGVDYLLKSQNKNGSWGSATGTTGFDVRAKIPESHDAFRVATTALGVMALKRVAQDNLLARASRESAINYLLEKVPKRATPKELYNIWAHGYAIQALSEVAKEMQIGKKIGEIKLESILSVINSHLDSLKKYETTMGGWNYYDFDVGAATASMEPTSFGTATIMAGLKEAHNSGVKIPGELIARGLKVLEKCRKPDGSYLYSMDWIYAPNGIPNKEKGSLGRSQACNFALYLYNYIVNFEDLKKGLNKLYDLHKFLDIGLNRQWPHESWYATSG